MARKYTKDSIKTTGIYDVRLHDIEDGEFLEKKELCVYQGYGTSMLVYTTEDDENISPLFSLYEEYIVYQRKVEDLPCPYTFHTEEEYNKWKNSKPS